MFGAPEVIQPFEDATVFSTNLNSVEFIIKLTQDTNKIFLNDVDISDDVTYVDSSDFTQEIPKPTVPFASDTYFKTTIDLTINTLNILVFKSEDIALNTETTEVRVTNLSLNSIGVDIQAPVTLSTDFKNNAIVVKWEDNNDIQNKPSGSGYNIYFTHEINDRSSTYNLINSDPYSDFNQTDTTQTTRTTTIVSSQIEVLVPEPTVDSFQKSVAISNGVSETRYFIVDRDDLTLTGTTVDQSSSSGQPVLFLTDTSDFEKVGAKLIIDPGGANEEEAFVDSFVAGDSLTLTANLTNTHNIGVSVVATGDRERELLFNQVKASASADLTTFNTYLTTFQHPNGAAVDLFVESEAQTYLEFLDNELQTNVALTPTEIDQYIVDAGIIVNKYSNLFPLYTFNETDADPSSLTDQNVQDYIDYCNIIVQTYPDLIANYTYNVIKTTENPYGLFTLLNDVTGTSPNFTAEYFTQSKVFISSGDLALYEGLYRSDIIFTEYPIYEYQNFINQTVETETVVRDADPVLSFEFPVDNTVLPSDQPLTLGQPTFFRVSFLYVDSVAQLVVESALSQEFFGVPLDVSGDLVQLQSPTPVQLQTEMIEGVTTVNPNMDLKPGTVNRTTFINPMSTVLSNLHYREYFREVSQSFLALLEFDEVDQDGNSSAVNQSQNKIALRNAYGLEDTDANNTLIQDFIDNRFDLLADNFGVSRGTPTNSSGTITLFTTELPADTTTIVVFAGTLVSTEDPQIDFQLLNSITAANFSQVADSSGRFSANVAIRSLETGSSTNVPANSITQVSSSGNLGLTVTNPAPTFGGQDELNNLELVERVKSKLISVDTGTINGYLQKIAETGLVSKSKVVASGDDLMRRDYDFVLGQSGNGAVDVYIQGSFPRSATETVGVFYEKTTNVQSQYVFNNVGDQFSYNSMYTLIDIGANNATLASDKLGIYSITRAELINGLASSPFSTPTNLILDNYVKSDNFIIGLDLNKSALTVSDVSTVTTPSLNIIRYNFTVVTVDYSEYINKKATTRGFSNFGNNVCERLITDAGLGYIEVEDTGSLGVPEAVVTTVSVDLSGNLDLSLFGGDCIFAEDVTEVSVPSVGNLRYTFGASVTDYTTYIGSIVSTTGYSTTGNNRYGETITNAGVGFIEIANTIGTGGAEIVATDIETRISSTVTSLETADIYFDVLFRRDFEHRWLNKPNESVSSVVDSNNVTYQSFLNYIPFNNSSLILEGGSLLEDSGVRILASPISTPVTGSFTSVAAVTERVVEVTDMWHTSAPILEDLDTSDLFYVDQDFTLVRSAKYFFVRLNDNFPFLSGQDFRNLRIKYGANYELFKDLTFRSGVDTLIDELKYSYYPVIDSADLGSLTETLNYDLIPVDQNKVAIQLKTFGFDTNPTDSLTVEYYTNVNVGSADNVNDPVASGVDQNLSLVPNIPVALNRLGIETSSIVVRPVSPLGVLLEPFILDIDYSISTEPDTRVFITRISSGNIQDNTLLNIYYTYADELTLNYIYDSQVGQLTEELENFAHAGSDFLVKKLASSSVDIKAIVYLFDLSNKDTVDRNLRNGIVSYVNQLDIGVGLYESDIIRIIDDTVGVRNVKVKLAKLSLSDDEVSYLETIDRSYFTEYSVGNVTTYFSPSTITNDSGDTERLLKYRPQPNGGTEDRERSVFVDNVKYELVDTPQAVSEEKGLAHIASSGSVYISFINETKKDPLIEVTYQVQSFDGAQDIEVKPFEFIQISNLTLNFVQQ